MEKLISGVKCLITREIYSSGNYRTFACMLKDTKDKDRIILNKYGNFTISGDLPFLKNNETYTLDLKEITHSKYGKQYVVEKVRDYELSENLDELSIEESTDILTRFTTPTQAATLLSVYPNFISLVINGRTNEIDVKKLKNIKDYRLSCYIREINTRFKYYYILIHHKQYKLTIGECQQLDNLYGSVEKVEVAIEENPYTVLIDVLGRGFLNVDKLLMDIRPELKESFERIEHIALHVLGLNEEDNNTYMDANSMAGYCAEIDRDCIPHIKNVCKESEKIWYNDSNKRIARMDTYIAESTISSYFINLLYNSEDKPWDFKWQNYTKINDGTLTDEQSELLHVVCEKKVVILNAGAGRGKTSSMKALIDMLEDNGKTYTLLAPTGRAAKRLSEQTHRKAFTVHRKCAMDCEIDSDVIICDEWSMYGLEHMMMIIKACNDNPNVRFVFSGDIHQLPSIALGCIMRDFIDSEVVPIITLTITFRYKEGGLSTVIDDIYNKKSVSKLLDFSKNNTKCIIGKNKDYTFIKSENSIDQIIDTYMSKINQGVKPIDIALITPWNVREFGTHNLNNAIQSVINPAKKGEKFISREFGDVSITFRKGDIVMNTKNNYKVPTYEGYQQMLEETGECDLSIVNSFIEVFNGDIGKILDIDENDIMVVQFDENIVAINEESCNKHVPLLLGYVGTIHKYQGSQCPHVILLTSKAHEKSYNNNLLYTGLSRASKEGIHIADLSVVESSIMIDGNEDRMTQLKELLIEDYKNLKEYEILEEIEKSA